MFNSKNFMKHMSMSGFTHLYKKLAWKPQSEFFFFFFLIKKWRLLSKRKETKTLITMGGMAKRQGN